MNSSPRKIPQIGGLEDYFRGKKTSEILAALRKESRYTLREISLILGDTFKSVCNWSQEYRCPPESKRLEIIRIFSDPNLPPSKARLNELHRTHGLTLDAAKRRWKLRLTIDCGKKLVGKRVTIHFPQCPAETAIEKRNAAVATCKALGLTVRISLQKRGHLGSGRRNAEPSHGGEDSA